MQAHLDLLAVLIKIRIVVLIIMTDVKAEAKAVEGAKQVSWFDLRSFDPTLKDLRKFVRLMRRLLFPIHNIDSKPKSSMTLCQFVNVSIFHCFVCSSSHILIV